MDEGSIKNSADLNIQAVGVRVLDDCRSLNKTPQERASRLTIDDMPNTQVNHRRNRLAIVSSGSGRRFGLLLLLTASFLLVSFDLFLFLLLLLLGLGFPRSLGRDLLAFRLGRGRGSFSSGGCGLRLFLFLGLSLALNSGSILKVDGNGRELLESIGGGADHRTGLDVVEVACH